MPCAKLILELSFLFSLKNNLWIYNKIQYKHTLDGDSDSTRLQRGKIVKNILTKKYHTQHTDFRAVHESQQ
jgi:hypothetical protein